MKKLMSISLAVAMILFLSVFAHATSNTLGIEQDGAFNDARITQHSSCLTCSFRNGNNGGRNAATITQDGLLNKAVIEQYATKFGNAATIKQVGFSNYAKGVRK